MYIRITDKLTEIKRKQIDRQALTVGYISSDEIDTLASGYGFDPDTVEACKTANPVFRSDVNVQPDYTFTELRIANKTGEDDFVCLYVMKNFFLVVDVLDRDSSTKNSFMKALRKYPVAKLCEGRIVCCFIESLLGDGSKIIEAARDRISDIEEEIVNETAGKDTNTELLKIKKHILKYQNFYEQILDVSEVLEDNDNDIFEENEIIYLSNLKNKVSRLCGEMASLGSSVDHLQDAYYALLDQRMNRTMNVLTVITTVFFPLTIIVGWYGMNFLYMPEFKWRYGYIYVILLSVSVVAGLIVLGKRKKWF